MCAWMVRAGQYGENEDFALDQGLAVIGWDEMPDLSGVRSREQLEALCREKYPDSPRMRVANYVGQLWTFKEKIKAGDLIVLPLKKQSAVAVGEVEGPYAYSTSNPEGAHHVRRVNWIAKDIPRSKFDQDILLSMGAFMTVCQIARVNVDDRIRALLEGKPAHPVTTVEGVETTEIPDLGQYALDQIRLYIGQKFRGHDLARIVDGLLRAQGYQTKMSPPGPDGGVDIIAGRGPMGFDPPRICVQVKSSDSPTDASVLQGFQGAVKNFKAEQGLLVAWGGFKNSVLAEARRLYFEVRFWDADDLITAVLQDYDKLPEDLRADLPLKRIWALIREETEA